MLEILTTHVTIFIIQITVFVVMDNPNVEISLNEKKGSTVSEKPNLINRDAFLITQYYTTLFNQMESAFGISNSFFIVGLTFTLSSYFNSLTSSHVESIFKVALFIGTILAIFWYSINFQYFKKYNDRYQEYSKHFEMVTNQDFIPEKQRTVPSMGFKEMWLENNNYRPTFLTFMTIPLLFLGICEFLFIAT